MLAALALAHTIGFADLRRVVSLSDPQISPDATRVVFVRRIADFDKDRSISQLILLNVRTRAMRPLTFGGKGVGAPRWSPDGSRIAFLSDSQVFVLRLDGGEAQQITRANNGVDGYAWSPDGSRFAYITQDANPHKKEIAGHLDAFEVGDNDYLHTSESMPGHLWMTPSSGGAARRLTSGPWSLETIDPATVSPVSWSADGSKIAFVHFPTPLVGDSMGTAVDVLDVRSGRRTALTRNGSLEGNPAFAPHGMLLAYTRNTGGDAANGVSIYVSAPGGNSVSLHGAVRRNIDAMTWAPDGKSLWLFGSDGDRTAAWYVCADGKKSQHVDLNGVSISEAGNTSRSGALAFIGTTPHHPGEIYLLASPAAVPVRLTNFNGFIDRLQLGRVRAAHWRNDGFNEDGILTLPPGYDPHRGYPLVLVVHGGPQGASTLGWNAQNQLFAAHGYIVFNPNYRGSTNLGDAYEHAISRDAGDGPGRDVMAGIAAVEKRHRVDRSRIAVSGWSYGGYMTSWMIGHYHIWKTAVAGAALNDWFDDYNLAFYVHTDEPFFGGSPWDPKYTAMWRAQSPITYAQNIRTPTLILGDIGDNNVTITNSFKMYHALKDNGVPVQFVAYPVHGHHPSDPVRSEDVTKRWLAWIDRYLK
jgi:dipeptidyl aminopeptidase/acylaminoacyl peptidase